MTTFWSHLLRLYRFNLSLNCLHFLCTRLPPTVFTPSNFIVLQFLGFVTIIGFSNVARRTPNALTVKNVASSCVLHMCILFVSSNMSSLRYGAPIKIYLQSWLMLCSPLLERTSRVSLVISCRVSCVDDVLAINLEFHLTSCGTT